MVDFKKLREAKAKPRPINPRDIFNALPKPPGISDLYVTRAARALRGSARKSLAKAGHDTRSFHEAVWNG